MSSKFLQSSCNYSEIHLFKSKILRPILESYNEYILKSKINNFGDKYYMIPNNNKKFYMLITNKIEINSNNTNSKYKILYFFPESCESKHSLNILEKNKISDFFVEVDNQLLVDFKYSKYLFEGYLYNNENYLITDILFIDNKIVDCNYQLRYGLIFNLIKKISTIKFNGHLNINIHPIFDFQDHENTNDNKLLSIFKNNFIYKDEINNIEIIENINLKKIRKNAENLNKQSLNETCIKRITPFKSDVYNVYNIDNNNHEGILYIKSMNDSKHIRELIKNKNFIEVKCIYNTHFNKWSIC